MNEQEQEELITQYVMGELEGEQRRSVEKLLEESESCRALARDIESTLGLLRDAMAANAPDVDRLDDVHAERVRRAAESASSKPRYVVRWLAQAAGVLILLGGIALIIVKPGYEDAPSTLASKNEKPLAAAPMQAADARSSNELTEPEVDGLERAHASDSVGGDAQEQAETYAMTSDQKAPAAKPADSSASEPAALLEEVDRVEMALAAKTRKSRSISSSAAPLEAPLPEEDAAMELAAASVTEREGRYLPSRSLLSKDKTDAEDKELVTEPLGGAQGTDSREYALVDTSESATYGVYRDETDADIDPEAAAQRALQWLASQQSPNGSWGDDTRTTSLALLALLPNAERADAVARAVRYLSGRKDREVEMSVPGVPDTDFLSQYALGQAQRLTGAASSRLVVDRTARRRSSAKKVQDRSSVAGGMKAISFRWDSDVRLSELLAYQQAQAEGGRRQSSWEQDMASRLIRHQLPSGNWPSREADEGLGDVGTTALLLILLQADDNAFDAPIPIRK